MSETADKLLRRIEAIDTAAADNRQRAETYQRMTEELQSVEASATSPDEVVTVVAGPGGVVKSITFTDRVRTVAPEALSATVMHTLAAARANAAQLQAEVVRRGLGDTELLDRVLESDERIFGDQRPRDPGPAPVPTTRRRHARKTEDEFFDDFKVFKPGR